MGCAGTGRRSSLARLSMYNNQQRDKSWKLDFGIATWHPSRTKLPSLEATNTGIGKRYVDFEERDPDGSLACMRALVLLPPNMFQHWRSADVVAFVLFPRLSIDSTSFQK